MPQDTPATDAGTERKTRDNVPETWAPVNRREMRDDVDRFRNLRMSVPTTAEDARQLAALALEYYEHAHEVATRTTITLGEADAEVLEMSGVAGDRHDDQRYRIVQEHQRITGAKMLEAEKELHVAGRRLETALAYLNSFKGE